MKKLTEGSPLKLILSFALPLLGGNLFQQLYNIVDSAIVGRILGADALAAVGATSSVQFLVLGFCFGLTCGFGIPIAQQYGADQLGMVRRTLFHSLVLTAAASVFLTVLCLFFCDHILLLLSTPQDIYRNSYQYLSIIFLGIPFTMLYNLLAAVLRSVGDSRTPFLFLVFSTILNIILDLICILIFRLGCAGAALATIISQGASAFLCLALIFRRYRELLPAREERAWDRHCVGGLLAMGVPMGLQFSITAIGSMFMQSANNGLGTVYVSGFAAAQKIKQFAMSPYDALATSTSTFVSQNYGAGHMDRIRKGIRLGLLVSVSYGIVSGILLIRFGRPLSMLFLSASHAEQLDAAAKYLWFMGFLFWTLSFVNVFRMCIQSLGFAGRAIFSGVMEMAARTLVALLLVPRIGYTAVCITDQCAWIAADIYLFFMLRLTLKKAEALHRLT